MGDLPEDLRAQFLRLGNHRAFARGDVIIAENDRGTEVYVIISGFVRVVNHTATGEQAMIAIRTSGDVVGELAALDGKPRTSTAIAASPTTVRVIDGPTFRAFTGRNPAVADAVARSVVAKLRSATRYRTETGKASVLTRVARVLEHLADSYGRTVSHGVLLDIPLPQQDLASLVATSPKGVARAYKELRDAGAITASYRQVVVLDLDLLQRYAAAAVHPE
jgi:CRP-like cAMP-binding protein